MQIYVSRNNQQAGPFEEARVLEMLRIGQLSPNDFGIRQGVGQWKPLGDMFRTSAPPVGNPVVQNIMSWARQNLTNQLSVEHRPASSDIKLYLIILGIVGVLPFLIGSVLANLLNQPMGVFLSFIGGILFVVLLPFFALAFLIQRFREKKFAAAFNSQGVVTKSNVLYEWDKLQYLNFLKFQHRGVHGQGLLPLLLSMLAVHLIRKATIKDDRMNGFNGVELIFGNGKVLVPATILNPKEVWDFIEKIPVQPRIDGRFDQNTMAVLQNKGLYNKPQNSAAAFSTPQLPTAPINQISLQPTIPQPPPNQINQPPAQIIAPSAVQKSNRTWIVAAALIIGLLFVGVGGIFAGYFLLRGSRTVKTTASDGNRNGGSSNSTQTVVNGIQTFPDPSPDKKPDFMMTADEFYRDAGDYNKEKQALTKYKDKVVEISGRVYLFKEFDGKMLYFRTSSTSLDTELLPSEANKLTNIKEGERVKIKCDVVDDFGVELKNCVVLERKPAVIADEKADFTITAKEYWNQVANHNLSYETQQKNRAKYFGKILEISGKVQKISGDGYFLTISEYNWVTCYPDDENKPMFAKLTEGQEVKFKGVDDGNSLDHCVVSR